MYYNSGRAARGTRPYLSQPCRVEQLNEIALTAVFLPHAREIGDEVLRPLEPDHELLDLPQVLDGFPVGVLLGCLEDLPNPSLVEDQRVGRMRRLPPAREIQPEILSTTAFLGLRPRPLHVVLLEQDLDQQGRSARTPWGPTCGALLARNRLAQEA